MSHPNLRQAGCGLAVPASNTRNQSTLSTPLVPTWGAPVGHKTANHIYDVIARTVQRTPPLYHLYIELNKAFNLVLLNASWLPLCGYRLPKQLVSSIGKVNAHAHE